MSGLPSPFPPDFRLLLASQSPRRRDLLDAVGVPYTVVDSEVEEEISTGEPQEVAELNALRKAQGALLPASAVREWDGAFVLGVDTIVTLEEAILGKPADESEARDMLVSLCGRSHAVVSGVALGRLATAGGLRMPVPCRPGSPGRTDEGEEGCVRPRMTVFRTASEVTEVVFSPLSPEAIDAYLASGEWEGKAGAYAIQGLAALFVTRMVGDYPNVVGLPLVLLGRLFRELRFDLLLRRWLD